MSPPPELRVFRQLPTLSVTLQILVSDYVNFSAAGLRAQTDIEQFINVATHVGTSEMELSFEDIEKLFNESLGYIRSDIGALRSGEHPSNYTIMLLVCCACEMLAAARGDRKHPERILAEILPPGDWRRLAAKLYWALRNGLAHGFDTRFFVDGKAIRIYISWTSKAVIETRHMLGHSLPRIGIQPVAQAICTKIDEFKETLRVDVDARDRFRRVCEFERTGVLNKEETAVWRRLCS